MLLILELHTHYKIITRIVLLIFQQIENELF